MDGGGAPPIPVILAVRDPALERPLLQAARDGQSAGLQIVGRVLDAAALSEQVVQRDAAAAIVSRDLAGLTTDILATIRARGLVVLALPAGGEPLPADWEALGVRSLGRPVDATALTVALRSAILQRGPVSRGTAPRPNDAADGRGHVLALFGGKGSPGRTTIATSLAVGLARQGQSVALVDADLTGGDVAAYLGLDPRANLFTLAHAARGQRTLSTPIVESELQSWGTETRLRVLVGIPRAAMAPAIEAAFLQSLLTCLRREYACTVVDLAAPRQGGVEESTRVVLAEAEKILIVCGGDLLGAWHCQQALVLLRLALEDVQDRLWLVLNRHDAAWQPAPDEVAAALEWPHQIFATIPFDHGAMQAALRDQRPLLDTRRPVGRALAALARRVQRELGTPVADQQMVSDRGRRWHLPALLGRRKR